MSVRIAEERRVATWPELVRRGHTPARIRAQLEAGRWRRWGRAIVLHNGPLSPRERWFVARAHGAPGAMLTSFTALEAVGLRGWERDESHVLTSLGARNSSRCPVPVRFHRVRDRSAARRYPCTRTQIPRQAAIVAAGSLPSARSACGLLAAVVQQRIVAPSSLREVVLASPRVRHRRQLLLTIADIEQGADALSEIDFVALCRRSGLPSPTLQAVRREPNGRRRYLDASWRRPDGRLLAVEVDGALHLSQRQWWIDQARQNELVLADTILLRYPSVVVRTDTSTVVDQLRRGLLLTDRPASVRSQAH